MNQANSHFIAAARDFDIPMGRLSPEGLQGMSLDEATRRELIEIWLAANDGAASEKDLNRLNAALTEDAEFRNHLLQIIDHQAWLTTANQPSGASPRFE